METEKIMVEATIHAESNKVWDYYTSPNHIIHWNFADASSGAANTSTLQNPTHTFSAAGTYNVSLTISGGPCNAPATITHAIDVLNITTTVQNVSCFGGNDGGITTAITGGNGTYVYNWSGGSTTSNLTGLTSGNYTLTAIKKIQYPFVRCAITPPAVDKVPS